MEHVTSSEPVGDILAISLAWLLYSVLNVTIFLFSEAGIYSPLDVLDFGIVRSCDEPKTLKLNLLNSGVKPLHIHVSTLMIVTCSGVNNKPGYSRPLCCPGGSGGHKSCGCFTALQFNCNCQISFYIHFSIFCHIVIK